MTNFIIITVHLLMNIGLLPEAKITQQETMNNMDKNELRVDSIGDDLTTMIQRYVAYNHWANQQFAEWLESASDEALNLEIESSFSSLKETVIHIWNAEYLWLQTVKNESSENAPGRNFNGSKENLLEGWLKASENFNTYVKTMTRADLLGKRPRSRGDGYTSIVDMIHHCMNHSTYHRGQLITMGRQAGLEKPPRTDFIYYVSLQ
jgi:uncharacterized damage-inducible protein DinB